MTAPTTMASSISSSNHFQPFSILPQDVKAYLFEFLDFPSLVRGVHVCKDWHQLIHNKKFSKIYKEIHDVCSIPLKQHRFSVWMDCPLDWKQYSCFQLKFNCIAHDLIWLASLVKGNSTTCFSFHTLLEGLDKETLLFHDKQHLYLAKRWSLRIIDKKNLINTQTISLISSSKKMTKEELGDLTLKTCFPMTNEQIALLSEKGLRIFQIDGKNPSLVCEFKELEAKNFLFSLKDLLIFKDQIVDLINQKVLNKRLDLNSCSKKAIYSCSSVCFFDKQSIEFFELSADGELHPTWEVPVDHLTMTETKTDYTQFRVNFLNQETVLISFWLGNSYEIRVLNVLNKTISSLSGLQIQDVKFHNDYPDFIKISGTVLYYKDFQNEEIHFWSLLTQKKFLTLNCQELIKDWLFQGNNKWSMIQDVDYSQGRLSILLVEGNGKKFRIFQFGIQEYSQGVMGSVQQMHDKVHAAYHSLPGIWVVGSLFESYSKLMFH